MQKLHDDSKACLTAFVQDSTLTVVIEMSLASWLVAGMIPGVKREPRKKIGPNPEVLLQLLYRWRDEAIKAGKEITRIAVAYETGRDGFWLARWLRARGIDARARAALADVAANGLRVPVGLDEHPHVRVAGKLWIDTVRRDVHSVASLREMPREGEVGVVHPSRFDKVGRHQEKGRHGLRRTGATAGCRRPMIGARAKMLRLAIAE